MCYLPTLLYYTYLGLGMRPIVIDPLFNITAMQINQTICKSQINVRQLYRVLYLLVSSTVDETISRPRYITSLDNPYNFSITKLPYLQFSWQYLFKEIPCLIYLLTLQIEKQGFATLTLSHPLDCSISLALSPRPTIPSCAQRLLIHRYWKRLTTTGMKSFLHVSAGPWGLKLAPGGSYQILVFCCTAGHHLCPPPSFTHTIPIAVSP